MDTFAYQTDTLAHKGWENDVTDTSFKPSRAGRGTVALLRGLPVGLGRAGLERGALVTRLPARLGCRPWVRKPWRKEYRTLNVHNVQLILCLSELWLLTTVPKTAG